jgi:hypothetical protein
MFTGIAGDFPEVPAVTDHAFEAIVLSDQAPSEVRRLVADLFEADRPQVMTLRPETLTRIALLASELISDAWDHGSEAATIRIDLDEGSVAVEVFDGPRHHAVGIYGRDDDVRRYRREVLAHLADTWSSDDLGDGHFARCEIRLPGPSM